MINYIAGSQLVIGSTITQLKKVTTKHLPHFHTISIKVKKRNNRKKTNQFGCNFFINYSPNFNGTSKNVV